MPTALEDPPVAATPTETPPPAASTPELKVSLDSMFDGLGKVAPTPPVIPATPPKDEPPEEPPVPTPAAEPTLPPAADITSATPPSSTDADIEHARKQLDNPHLTERQKRPWKKMVENREAYDAEKRTFETTLAEERRLRAEAEARAAAAPTDYEQVKKDLAEARARADKFELVTKKEKSSTFVKKYGEREQTLTTGIEGTLKEFIREQKYIFQENGEDMEGLSVDYIRRSGGLLAFAKSNPQGYGKLLDFIHAKSPVSADILRRNVGDLAALDVEKRRELDAVEQNPQQFAQEIAQTEQQQREARTQQEQQLNVQLNTYRNGVYEKLEPLKILPIPEKATSEERSRIEARNARATTARSNLVKMHDAVFLGKATPTDLAEGALRAVLYDAELEAHADTKKQLAALQKENERLANAGLVHPAHTVTPPPPPPPTPVADEPDRPRSSSEVAAGILDSAATIASRRTQQASGTLGR